MAEYQPHGGPGTCLRFKRELVVYHKKVARIMKLKDWILMQWKHRKRLWVRATRSV